MHVTRTLRVLAGIALIAGITVVGGEQPAAAATVEQNGPLNYAGPNCPGVGWNCTTQTSDLIQQTTSPLGQNVLDASSGESCQVVQIASGGSNEATCNLSSSAVGAALSADITQTNTTGINTADVDLTVSGQTGDAQAATEDVSIEQDNVDGANTASVTQTVGQTSNVILNAPVSQTQQAEIDALVDQSTTGSGDNTVVTTQALTQSQSGNGTSVSQVQALPATGTDPEPDTDAVLIQNAASGDNLATLDQDITRTQTATAVAGAGTQVQGTAVGGTLGFIDPDSETGTSHYDADQTKDWDQELTALGAQTQEQHDPQDCCIVLDGNFTPDTCTIDQTTTLDQNTDGFQEAHLHAAAVAHDTCTANQSATINGEPHTNSASGTIIDTSTNCEPDCQSQNHPISSATAEIQNGQFPGYGPTATAARTQTVDYRVTYTNDGSVPGTGTTVAIPVPANTQYVDCDPGCSVAGGTATFNLGTVPAQTDVPVILTVQVDGNAPDATVTTHATVDTAEEPDPVDSNSVTLTIATVSTAEAHEAVRNVSDGQAFTGAATPPLTDATPGEIVEYRITYHNHAGLDSAPITINAPLPAQTTFVSCHGCVGGGASGGTITFHRATGEADGSRVGTFQVRVNAGATGDIDHSSSATRQSTGATVPSNRTTVHVT